MEMTPERLQEIKDMLGDLMSNFYAYEIEDIQELLAVEVPELIAAYEQAQDEAKTWQLTSELLEKQRVEMRTRLAEALKELDAW